MVYQTVFDVAQNGFTGWTGALFPLIFVAVGTVLYVRRNTISLNGIRPVPKACALAFILLGLLFSGWLLWSSYGAYWRAAARLENGRYDIAEGRVRDFQQGGTAGKYFESFMVGGTRFAYRGNDSGHAFHQLAIYGGPIHEGLPVRISHSGDAILRLEIAH